MWYEDLGPCSYWGLDEAKRFIAVGWLDAGHDFARGDVAPPVLDRLCRSLIHPWEPMGRRLRGFHGCSFCLATENTDIWRHRFHDWWLRLGADNLLVPADGFLFVAPSLIVHYIAAHGYLPPAPFLDAVARSPEMRSDAFFALIERHGPPDWSAAAVEEGEVERSVRGIRATEGPMRVMRVGATPSVEEALRTLAEARPEELALVVPPCGVAELRVRTERLDCDIAFVEVVESSQDTVDAAERLGKWGPAGGGGVVFLDVSLTANSPPFGRVGWHETRAWPLTGGEILALIEEQRYHRAWWKWLRQTRPESTSGE